MQTQYNTQIIHKTQDNHKSQTLTINSTKQTNRDNGYKIIRISKQEKDKDKQKLHIFSHVSTNFFSTMSKAQGKE